MENNKFKKISAQFLTTAAIVSIAGSVFVWFFDNRVNKLFDERILAEGLAPVSAVSSLERQVEKNSDKIIEIDRQVGQIGSSVNDIKDLVKGQRQLLERILMQKGR